ncbi:hypothetical protein WJX73_002718 [Symbiochloris irregularis]|uniref:Uncharacterized protein n=1 Tax=Symbiochloris irregularis TaxID=706552 RepID=A0AAW1NW56_9CHLO
MELISLSGSAHRQAQVAGYCLLPIILTPTPAASLTHLLGYTKIQGNGASICCTFGTHSTCADRTCAAG